MDDVALTDEDWRHITMRARTAVRMLFETPLMVLKGWWLMVKTSFHRWAAAALIEGEEPDHADREHSIEPALVPIDEQGREDEVMDQKEQEKYAQIAPYHKDLLPVERQVTIACRTYKQAQQWRCEE